MARYSFWLEPLRASDSPIFLKEVSEPDTVRPVLGTEFTVGTSRTVYRIVRIDPTANPGEPDNVAYFAVVVGSRSDRLRTLTGLDAKGL